MFGLGKKPESAVTARPEELGLRIHTIPKPYYGKAGIADATSTSTIASVAPVAVIVAPSPVPPVPAPAAVVVTGGGGTSAIDHTPRHESSTHDKQRLILWVVLGLVMLTVIGAATWYYTRGSLGPSPVGPASVPVVIEPSAEPVIPLPTEPPVPVVPALTPATTVESLKPIIDTPDTIDFDHDGLTDIEEELYKSDVAAADTDGDIYADGLEVVSLYDPKSTAPALIASSTNVGGYRNQIAGYHILYPVDWLAAAVNEAVKDEVLFTSLTGEFVSLKQYPLQPEETFVSWFTKNTQVFYSSLTAWTNRVGNSGWHESHRLRYYFARPDSIFILEYHPGVRSSINFRTSMRMMAESFQYVAPTANPVAPAPLVLPEVPIIETPSSTSTSTISSSTLL